MTDPLNLSLDLSNFDTTRPLLVDQDYTFQVVESAIVPNKEKSGHNWQVKYALAQSAQAQDGREVKPNFPIVCNYALQARPDSTDPDAFKRGLGDTIDAIFGSTMETRPLFNQELVNAAKGRTVIATVYTDEYNGEKSSKIRKVKKAV